MFKIIFPAALLMNIVAWYSPYGWGATYGPHPGRNLLLSGILYILVYFLILIELAAWKKKGIPRGWPVTAGYATWALCHVVLSGFSGVGQLTSVHGQETFHRVVLIWSFVTLVLLGIGNRLRHRAASVADATR